MKTSTPNTYTSNTYTSNTSTPKTYTPKTDIPNTSTPNTLNTTNDLNTPNTYTPNTYTSNTSTPNTSTPKTDTPNTLNTTNDLNTPNTLNITNDLNKQYNDNNDKDPSNEASDEDVLKVLENPVYDVLKNNNKNQNNVYNRNTQTNKNNSNKVYNQKNQNNKNNSNKVYNQKNQNNRNNWKKQKNQSNRNTLKKTDPAKNVIPSFFRGMYIEPPYFGRTRLTKEVFFCFLEGYIFGLTINDNAFFAVIFDYDLAKKTGESEYTDHRGVPFVITYKQLPLNEDKQMFGTKDFTVILQPTKNKMNYIVYAKLRHRRNVTKKPYNLKFFLNTIEQS